jgi:4-aminobutyrate aminotransferase-like enzyme
VLGSAEIMDLPEVGEMSSTHSANPLVCAAGIATLDEIERKNLVSEAQRKGVIFFERLGKIQKKYSDCISNVSGKGLLAALIFRDSESNPQSMLASRISERCMQKGLLVVYTGRGSIKFAPPLTIVDEALIEGLEVIDETISEILQEVR